MNRKNVSKLFSISLSLALVATSAPMPARAAGPMAAAPAFVAKLTPPEQFGYVASSFAPKNETTPRLIVVADLHGHVDVQKNIMGILDHSIKALTASDGASPMRRVPVFVEGGWDKNLEEPLRGIKNSKVRAFLANYFLHKSELQAAQAYSEMNVGSGSMSLTGVENKEEYLAHKKHFAKTYPSRRTLLQAIVRHEEALKALQSVSMDSTFVKLQTLRDQYLKGQIAPDLYARTLSRMARKWNIAGPLVETLQNSKTASAGDLDLALLEVHRRVAQKIAAGRPLTSYLRRSLGNEEVLRRNLAFIDSNLDLLKRTLSNQLTPEEVPMVLAKIMQLAQTANLLLDGEKLDVDAATVIRDAVDFYPFAFLRDESLVANSLAAMEKDETHPSTGILITGGFHSGAISEYLQKLHIPYLMIYPTVSRDVTAQEQFNYIKRMCDEHVTAEELTEDYNRPARLDYAQKNAIASAVTATVAPEAIDPKKGGTSGLLDALEPTAEALLATVPGAQVSPVIAVNPTVAATLDVKDGGKLVARDNSKAGDVAVALSRLLAPILEKAGGKGVQSAKTVEIRTADGDLSRQISFKDDKKAVVQPMGPAVVEGVGTDHVVITIRKDWADKLDLASLGTLFKAESASGLQEGKFNAKQKAAAKALYALAHEIVHSINGSDEKAPVLSLAAAISLAAGAHDGATGTSDSSSRIPLAFAQRFVEATSEVLPDADYLGSLDAASHVGTVTVAGMTELISNALEPVVLGDVAVQRMAEALQKEAPQATTEEARAIVMKNLQDLDTQLAGGKISPAKWKQMVAALLEKMRNAQFSLAA